MPEIQSFDELSETAKWLICHTIGDKDVWPSSGHTPYFSIVIGEHEIDPTEFFSRLAHLMDQDVDRRANKGAIDRFDNVLGVFVEDVDAIHAQFMKLARGLVKEAGSW